MTGVCTSFNLLTESMIPAYSIRAVYIESDTKFKTLIQFKDGPSHGIYIQIFDLLNQKVAFKIVQFG